MTGARAQRVELFFEPGCPWTWKTACWLRSTGHPVVWRAFRLELASDQPVPAAWAPSAAASQLALRLVEHLAAAGRHDEAGAFYAALGSRIHDDLEPASPDLVRSTAAATGLAGADLAALDDVTLDEAVRRAFEEARTLTGPDLGSPVLAVTLADGRRRAFFGPIVTGVLDADEAAQLWEATLTLLHLDRVVELKRGRTLHAALDASLAPHA